MQKRSVLRRAWPLLILLGLALPATDCAKNPVTGKRQLALISEAQEIAIGEQSHPEVLAEFGELDDPELQSFLSRQGQELARGSHRPDLPWTFTVVDSPVVNAFALPGGYIYLTRQILAHMNSEAEVAGVLGHEIAHVTARHSVTQISRAQLVGLGLGLGSVFSPEFRNWSQLAEIGAGVLFLKYSRDAERQADELGVEYMFQQGYDPRELSDFFAVFEFMREESGGALPNWLSSHPAPPDRREATLEQARQLLASAPGRTVVEGREDHLRRVDGLIFGENPREGFVQDSWFLHPDLRFRLAVPPGWRVQNSRSSVVFGEPNGGAAIQLTLSPRGVPAEQRARELASQPGVSLQQSRQDRINGNPALLGFYQVQSASGSLAALAAWIDFRGNLYQLLALAPAQQYSSFSRELEATVRSFDELRDRRALEVQPDRVDLYRTREGETLESVAARFGGERFGARELMVLNRVDPDRRLAAGTLLKVVRPGRP